jgi:hypothetical protein
VPTACSASSPTGAGRQCLQVDTARSFFHDLRLDVHHLVRPQRLERPNRGLGAVSVSSGLCCVMSKRTVTCANAPTTWCVVRLNPSSGRDSRRGSHRRARAARWPRRRRCRARRTDRRRRSCAACSAAPWAGGNQHDPRPEHFYDGPHSSSARAAGTGTTPRTSGTASTPGGRRDVSQVTTLAATGRASR